VILLRAEASKYSEATLPARAEYPVSLIARPLSGVGKAGEGGAKPLID